MKKSFVFLLVFSFILPIFGQNSQKMDEFFKILARVESSNNPKAFNKKENAIGIYQIRPLYFEDAKEFDESLSKYSHIDCYNPEVSRLVATAYFKRYCKNGTFEQMARCHNSGPQWRKKYKLTDNYWARFKSHQK